MLSPDAGVELWDGPQQPWRGHIRGGWWRCFCPPLGGAEGPRRGLLAPSPSCGRPGLWASRCEMEAQGGPGGTVGVQMGSAGPDAGRGTNSPKPGSINSQEAWGESGFSINSPVQAQQLGPCQSHGPAQIRTAPCSSARLGCPGFPPHVIRGAPGHRCPWSSKQCTGRSGNGRGRFGEQLGKFL